MKSKPKNKENNKMTTKTKIIGMILFIVSMLSSIAKDSVFGGSVGAGFSDEYVFRGVHQSGKIATANAELTVYGAYADVGSVTSLDKSNSYKTEVDFATGYKFMDLWLGTSIDVGTTVYTYPNAKTNLRQTDYTIEPLLGLFWDKVFLKPSIYTYYDVNRDALTFEGRVSEVFTSAQSIPYIGQISIIPYAYAGHSWVKDDQPRSKVKIADEYSYLTGGIDLAATVYGFTWKVGPQATRTFACSTPTDLIYYQTSVTYNF